MKNFFHICRNDKMNKILQRAHGNPLFLKFTIILETIALDKSSFVHCSRYKGNSAFNLDFLQQHSNLTFDIQQNITEFCLYFHIKKKVNNFFTQ